jgi:hypothetical protein
MSDHDIAAEVEEFLERGGEPVLLSEIAWKLKAQLEPFGEGAKHLRDQLDTLIAQDD